MSGITSPTATPARELICNAIGYKAQAGIRVGVGVAVKDGVGVGVSVAVAVGVGVAVSVGVAVFVGVAVDVFVGVTVGVGVSVGETWCTSVLNNCGIRFASMRLQWNEFVQLYNKVSIECNS